MTGPRLIKIERHINNITRSPQFSMAAEIHERLLSLGKLPPDPAAAFMKTLADVEIRSALGPFPGRYAGPAIHIRRDPAPRPDSGTRNDNRAFGTSGAASEAVLSRNSDPDNYERTDSGLYVPKGGRPEGTTDVKRDEYVRALGWFVSQHKRPPSQSELSKTLRDIVNQEPSLDTIQRYAKRWFGGWPEVKRYCIRLMLAGN